MGLASIFKKTYTEQEKEQFDFLRQNILFRNLTEKQLMRIIPLLHLRDYKADEVVFFRNDPSQAVYIVKEGKVRLYIETNSDEEELIQFGHGYIFGQNGLLSGAKRPYTAIVVEDRTQLMVLPQVAMQELMEKDIELKTSIFSTVAKYYNDYITNIFDKYRTNYGFFEIRQIYDNEYVRKAKKR